MYKHVSRKSQVRRYEITKCEIRYVEYALPVGSSFPFQGSFLVNSNEGHMDVECNRQRVEVQIFGLEHTLFPKTTCKRSVIDLSLD